MDAEASDETLIDELVHTENDERAASIVDELARRGVCGSCGKRCGNAPNVNVCRAPRENFGF